MRICTLIKYFFSIVCPTATTDERRHSDSMFASEVLSISDLIRRATDLLKLQANEANTVLPSIPSEEWVRLQFVPNNHTVATAALFTGKLGVGRAIQTRTMRKSHKDQHWVNACTRYCLEWMVELRALTNGVEFFGQDDKAKIPVGDGVPISTGVRPNNRTSIVDVDSTPLQACDHDFHVGSLVCSAILRCNIPKSIGDSFFIGGSTDGYGQLFYTLRDAVFDPSKVFDHTSQLIYSLKEEELNPFVLVLQTDGGPDHSIKFLTTKMALLALFIVMDLDHLLVLRGAPNGSAYNKIERAMSMANGALTNVSTKRAVMPKWAEDKIKSCNSMSAIREKASEVLAAKRNAIAGLKEMHLRYGMRCIQTWVNSGLRRMFAEYLIDGDKMEALVKATTMVTNICNLVCSFLGLPSDCGIEMGDVSGVIETREGLVQTRSTTIGDSVSMSKRKKLLEIASRDLQKAWSASVQAPIDAINSRLARILISGRPAEVVPRVNLSIEESLHSTLKTIDDQYDPNYSAAKDLEKMPGIKKYLQTHTVILPYSISFVKCDDPSCSCKPYRSPQDVRKLALQRQPTPKRDTTNKNRTGHFLKRKDALLLANDNNSAVSDLSDLPSKADEKETSADGKAKRDRDADVCKALSLRSWDAKKVRMIARCYNCGKGRCIFSPLKNDAYFNAVGEHKRTLESVDYRHSCGDLIFADEHPTAKIITQRLNLTCESKMEKEYYNPGERDLVTVDVCIHCGEEGGSDFLYNQKELEAMKKSGGKMCYPICKLCLAEGKKIETYTKKKTNQTQKRKEDLANKNAGASKRRKG